MGLVSREQRINEHLARLQLHIERSHCAETRRHNRAFLRGVRVALWCLSMRMTPAQIDQELRAELFGTPPPSVGRATPGPRPRAEIAE
ncbi:hypothetical protein [Pseudomonas sp. B10(2017)]|uniref:hypothetical protein n=1 Tax=Pseudomonas sp. B10(2017) TaxID=1981749 RepID=UPI001179F8E4|nr:hypothetical protein [Pseudomonas sp. B10(2017)]